MVDQPTESTGDPIREGHRLLFSATDSVDNFARKYSPVLSLIRWTYKGVGLDSNVVDKQLSWSLMLRRFLSMPPFLRILFILLSFLAIAILAQVTSSIGF